MKTEPFNASPEEAARAIGAYSDALVCGTGFRKYPAEFAAFRRDLGAEFDVPSAARWVNLAVARFHAVGPSDLVALEPLYIRGADAALPATPLRTA